jgi:hypothetical protein
VKVIISVGISPIGQIGIGFWDQKQHDLGQRFLGCNKRWITNLQSWMKLRKRLRQWNHLWFDELRQRLEEMVDVPNWLPPEPPLGQCGR